MCSTYQIQTGTFRRRKSKISRKRSFLRSHCRVSRGAPSTPGDIWPVVMLACVDKTSIWETCKDTDGTPCDDTTLKWLHTLNREWLEVVANLFLRRLAMTILDPDRSRIVSIDFIDNPYHGDHYADEGELCSMAPKDGTTTCHRYCTAYVVSNGKPVTLAMTYVRNDEDEADAVERVLARVETYPFEIKQILMDRDAFVGELIGILRQTAPPVFPVRTGKDSLRKKLSVSASYMTEETICEGKQHEQMYPPAVNVTYQNGDRGKSGVKTVGYAAYGLEDRTPAQVATTYDKRAQIEKSYEKFREARALTTSPSTTIRLFYVGVGFLLEQLWLVLQWAVLAHPRRGGRVLPDDFTFNDGFLHGIQEVLDEELGWKDKHRTNGEGLPPCYDHGLG